MVSLVVSLGIAGILGLASVPAPEQRPPSPTSDAELLDTLLVPEPDGLTADAVAAASWRHDPRADLSDALVQQARRDRTQAGLGWLPQLRGRMSLERRTPVATDLGDGAFVVAGAEGPLSAVPCPGPGGDACVGDAAGGPVVAVRPEIETLRNNALFAVEATLPLSDYLLAVRPTMRAASATVRARRAERQAARLEVQLRARQAYYDWVHHRAARLVHEHSERRLERHDADAQRALATGAVDQRRALLVRGELARARAQRAEAAAEEHAALVQLAIVTGEDPDRWLEAPPAVGEDFRRPVEPPAGSPRSRPADEAIAQHVKATQAIRARALASILPRVGLSATMLHGNPHPWVFPPSDRWTTTWSVGVVSSWSIDGAIRGGVERRRQQADLDVAVARQAGARRERDIARRQTAARRSAAQEALEHTRVGKQAARERLRLVRRRYAAGSTRLSQLLDAENALAHAALAELDASIRLRVLRLHEQHLNGALEPARAP